VLLADFTASDGAWVALAVFLVLAGLGLVYSLVRLGAAFGQVSRTVRHAEEEVLPVIGKAGGTLDRVNRELDKVDEVTDRAVGAVKAVDGAVRSLAGAVSYPAQRLAGLAAGLRYGISSFRVHRDLDEALRVAREAAARRQAELAAEMGEGEDEGRSPPAP
jgi:uncharacterized protein YoxC